MKKLGTYNYKYMCNIGARTLMTAALRVEIVGESKNCYHVKYLGFHANGARPGHTAWVHRDKVKLDEVYESGEARVTLEVTKHGDRINFRATEIRLPYKDNDDED